MRSYGVEVPDTDPLLFIAVLGVGGVAVLVDFLAVAAPPRTGGAADARHLLGAGRRLRGQRSRGAVRGGAAGYLWLLVTDNVDRVRRFGRRFTGDGRDVDVWEASPLASAGRRLAVVGVAVAVMLPLAVPGMTGGLLDSSAGFGQRHRQRQRPGGTSGRIDLFASLAGQLNQSQVADLVKVTTSEPDPFYLRYAVADELRPSGFQARNPNGRSVNRGLPDPAERNGQGVRQTTYRATVEVTKSLSMSLMPVYAEPVRTDDLNDNWLYDNGQQVVFSNRENSRGGSTRSTTSARRTRRRRCGPHSRCPPTTRYADSRPPPRGGAGGGGAGQGLIQGKRTDYDRVLSIYQHFSADNGFSYRLSTESGSSGQDIVDFLTNKVGYCQQYAAAMAWLVRAAGIPARVAFGFTNGSKRDGDTFTLTNLNLHAWTEVYFDGVGWVPFDATPAYGVPGSTRSDWAPDTDAPEPSAPDTGGTDTRRAPKRRPGRPVRTTPTGTPTTGLPSAVRRRPSNHRSGPGGQPACCPAGAAGCPRSTPDGAAAATGWPRGEHRDGLREHRRRHRAGDATGGGQRGRQSGPSGRARRLGGTARHDGGLPGPGRSDRDAPGDRGPARPGHPRRRHCRDRVGATSRPGGGTGPLRTGSADR
ncbi:transglutaminaseTgpA domain-containing protein [Micromonospora sp. M12]